MRKPIALLVVAICLAANAFAADNGLGERPYLGWSSWSLSASKIPGYGSAWLNEANVKAMSDAMAHQLQAAGYTYINVDGGWTKDFDSYGRPVPDRDRFPHGIKVLQITYTRRGKNLGCITSPDCP